MTFRDVFCDSYGVKTRWILFILLICSVIPITILGYFSYQAEINLVNSFDCPTFKTYLTEAENGGIIINKIYLERCT